MSLFTPFINPPMNTPQSLDQEPISPPVPPIRSKEEEEDVDYDFDSEEEGDGFHIRGRLSVGPKAEELTIRELHSLIHEGSIYLNPPYQRDVVWSASKQSLLIDSIFRNFWIPPVVFSVTDDDGVPIRVCVDGKQRLTSIQRFLDGQLPYVQSKKNYYFTAPESMKQRLQIPQDKKEEFLNKKISCVEYTELTPELEREIFHRVQLGMALTTAEKWATIVSPWTEWITKLENRHVSIEGGLSQLLDWDTKRGREFSNVAQMVYICDGHPNSENVPTAPKMQNWLARMDPPGEKFKKDVDDAMTEYCHLASDPDLNSGKSPPWNSSTVGVLLYVLRRSSSEEKARAVHHLRSEIRRQFPSQVRFNAMVGAALWKLINDLKQHPITPATPGSTSKRRRKMSESEDEEYRPAPVKSIGKGRQTRSRHD
ncbi:hypothetical protein FB45DRAFT_904165 [Roridomyces roridus]|uniref:GmrSD restriction endonucleases N-terminal domain-containing protein n=1 Tax=Roridomyces roridus TaxID=1738132 RepID=A0AAD7C4S0_9AGAR|nr:hypothetical protein FB45DRAFT_904165 [Roridomyces roridus]